ncbi:undecaprenyl-diphosphate phosphatase [Aliishimia ponticola]|uniref:Undecaprenyl-diphosphatase n=1 Tax=Aliishimia ponticola TaxID=2499833 RepID=A0A4S4N6H4_9RHOB|nr:undecaprenyl-diphosphate phosphatase [Aliishimia ponticola]THH34732.1 undecaprenyl-diphosphate phosphatase [Aliishimia ponticola]
MSLLHLFILAVIQGLTEFLPVSSSGHLILLPGLTSLDDQGLAMDVAVHVGTLAAVIAYFWQDVKIALAGTLRLMQGRVDTDGARLAWHLLWATIPVIIAGLILHVTGWADAMRSITVIGWTMLGFGLVLYWADMTGATDRTAGEWTLKHAIYMGLAQALALIPGTSRSGITITAGRKLGYDRESAARLAMLMSIPTILASGALLAGDAIAEADSTVLRDASIGAAFAFAAALLALVLMMRLLRSVSFTPYVIYRVILGIVLLAIAYS